MKSGIYYGIDFGTTNTSVYMYKYEEGYGGKGTGFGTDGKDTYPFSSCIAISKTEENSYKYGREVKENINRYAQNYRIITSFKSLLGTDEEVVVNNKRYKGKELAAIFLNHIKTEVRKQRPDFSEVILSIPVDFSPKARTELLSAAEEIGLKVRGFVSEPSAAYISKVEDIKAYSKVLVIDWGGGTLDLSILDLQEKRILEDAVYGIKFGGDDIDKELAKRLMPKIFPDKAFDELNPTDKDKLMGKVEQMKIHFSKDDDDYTMLLGPGAKAVDIDYDYFADIVTPLISSNVLPAIIKIMNIAQVKPENIDAVILAGGSSGLKPFADMILSLFGQEKIIFDDENNNYQWMVAKGAAITSAIDCKFILSDDICILLSDGETYPIMKKDINKVGDVSDVLTFSLTDDSQDAHFIFTDSSGKNRYATVSVNTKGYLDEQLSLTIGITKDQIANVIIENKDIGKDYYVTEKINKLRFYYDLNEIEE